MEHHTTTTRAEAERLLGIAEKLLRSKDLASCKDFAVLALETEPLLEGSDQILAVTEVLLAAEKRVNSHPDWYSILQIGQRTDDVELIKKQYRRLALLLHPDKNKFAFADSAFRLVADAWSVLSDPGKKSIYDNEFSLFAKVDLMAMKRQKDLPRKPQQGNSAAGDGKTTSPAANDFSQQKLPVRRSARGGNTASNASNAGEGNPNSGAGKKGRTNLNSNLSRYASSGNRSRMSPNFWTVCPYCYNLYEYPRIYEGCCLRCSNCERGFTGMEVVAKPPTIPGTDTYYCCWGFFPMGFSGGDLDGDKNEKNASAGFQNWMPPMFSAVDAGEERVNAGASPPVEGVAHGAGGMVGVRGEGVVGAVGVGVGGAGGSNPDRAKAAKGNAAAKVPKEGAKKRGRPRKVQ